MIVYKLRHVPTGLFFKPATGYLRKDNLSTVGKLYAKRPSLRYVKSGYYHRVEEWNVWYNRMNKVSKHEKYVEGDWEIVSFKLVEIK